MPLKPFALSMSFKLIVSTPAARFPRTFLKFRPNFYRDNALIFDIFYLDHNNDNIYENTDLLRINKALTKTECLSLA